MTDQTEPASPRRRGRPCKEPPWLKEVAQLVARGTPLRQALWRLEIYMLSEQEKQNLYRLKKFRQYYEQEKLDYFREWGRLPGTRYTRRGERLLAALEMRDGLEGFLR